MKKITFILICCVIGSAAFAQTTEKTKKQTVVPEVVQKAFKHDFPDKKVSWEMENDAYEAEFDQDGAETAVIYDKAGTRLQTEMEIKVADLPANITEYMNKNVTAKVKEATKITDNKGVVTYEAEVGKKEFIFDANGQFLKAEMEDDDDDGDDD